MIRYFFLVDPRYQVITNDGGLISLSYMLSDILGDLKKTYFHELPKVLRSAIPMRTVPKQGKTIKLVNFKDPTMKAVTIPITLICHTGKADISVFRRSKYDINLYPNLAEIQGGWCTTEHCYFRVPADRKNNYYWVCDLTVRDTLSLTPADNKSLKSLGNVIGMHKVVLPEGAIEHMSSFAVIDPQYYYQYAMNDADLVVAFCSSLFGCNRKLPMTLSSAAASSMKQYLKRYFGVERQEDFDYIYRGLKMIDEGKIPSKDDCLKFLKATRYVPVDIDSRLFSEFSEEAYTGGFNASFFIGWITEHTTDYDLKNAYPTAMASILDVDWHKPLRDLPREYDLTLQDVVNPLIPMMAYIDFEFPDDCYCPCIPVPVSGLKIYPYSGHNVYACGVDIYLALKLGARIRCHRGFVAQILEHNGRPSQSLAFAVSCLVRDRAIAKRDYPDDSLVEQTLKTMVNSCYGKTAQNVSPKTRYNAKIMGRVDAEPSAVTSPYHACYTTALVRGMLIACINELHGMGYRCYSVTTDGFICNAPENVLVNLDAFGFTRIFQEGRYTLNGNRSDCKENHVWVAKHYNDIFLNITTRGNVAVNDEGVLAHNSYTTGEVKDSRADRDAYIIAVLSREGRLKCATSLWTQFSDIVERKHDFHVTETIRELSMNFDYKRCPILETARDTEVHYEAVNGQIIDTVIAEYDTRAFHDVEEFMNYRISMKHEDCVKVVKDLKRVKAKSTIEAEGYIGNDADWAILRSIIMGYRMGIYSIPSLEGLKGDDRYTEINSWGICDRQFKKDDWTNCGRTSAQAKILSYNYVAETLKKIQEKGGEQHYER